MKCRYSESDIALYVEGDLPPAKACDIQTHLTACRACRDLETSLRESQAMLKGLRKDAVSAAALSSVRTRVLAEIGARKPRWTWARWVYAVAGGMFIAVIGVGLAFYQTQPDVQPGPQVDILFTKEAGRAQPEPPSIPDVTPQPPASRQGFARRALIERPYNRTPQSVGAVDDRPGAFEPMPAQIESPAEPPRQIVVKLLTDDPNIVIYWLVDQENGGTL